MVVASRLSGVDMRAKSEVAGKSPLTGRSTYLDMLTGWYFPLRVKVGRNMEERSSAPRLIYLSQAACPSDARAPCAMPLVPSGGARASYSPLLLRPRHIFRTDACGPELVSLPRACGCSASAWMGLDAARCKMRGKDRVDRGQ